MNLIRVHLIGIDEKPNQTKHFLSLRDAESFAKMNGYLIPSGNIEEISLLEILDLLYEEGTIP